MSLAHSMAHIGVKRLEYRSDRRRLARFVVEQLFNGKP